MARKKTRSSSDKYIVLNENEATPPCPHIEKCITPTKVKSVPPHSVFGRCSECSVKDKILLCLKCGSQYCTTHGTKHFNTNNHHLHYGLTSGGGLYCTKCAKVLDIQSHSLLPKVSHIVEDIIKKQGTMSNNVVMSPKNIDKPANNPLNGHSQDKDKTNLPHVIEPHISGLKNTGVICFFNSVLQNLIQTPMLRACIDRTTSGYSDVMKSAVYGILNIDVPSGTQDSMVWKIQSFLQLIDAKERSKALYPFQVFREMCSYNGCLSDGQQDAQECFHAIVHSISTDEAKRRKNAVLHSFGVIKSTFKDLPKEKKKKINDFANLARSGTFIDCLFGGTTLNQITCLTCNSVTKTLDQFVDLSVPLPKKEEFKVRLKQRSSGEDGMSKHQKKKQQKENRKKGKKGRERKNSNQPNSEQNGDNKDQKQNENENGNLNVTVEECDMVEHNVETCETVETVETVELETCEVVTVDDVMVEDLANSELEDVILEIDDQDTELCDKLDTLNLNGSVGKLKGGFNLHEEDEEEDGGMFSGMFNDDEDGDGDDELVKSSENLDLLMDDLNISQETFEKDTLEACLAQFCREELLTDDNQFSCINCARERTETSSLNISCAQSTDSSLSDNEGSDSGSDDEKDKIRPVLRDARCRYYLNTLPPILVVHLKRFSQNYRGFPQKDKRSINYPVHLDLDPFTIGGTGNRYKLFGVVDHSGSLNRGHYTAYVRKRDTTLDKEFTNQTIPLNSQVKLLGQINSERAGDSGIDKWYFCNDERISDTSVKRVLDADAYLLFYERCQPYSS